jgi:hypothetical protein
LARLPQAERPTPYAHKHSGILDREVQPPPSHTELRRQRVALLTAEFGFTRPQ